MMQEHPFFSRPQIYFGKPIDEREEEDENILEDPWCISLGEAPRSANEKIGLCIFWTEPLPSEETYFY